MGLALSVVALALYLSTLSRSYLGDGIQFAMIVEHGGLSDFLKPNHMLYPLILTGFYRLWEAFSWSAGALIPLQVASALGGAAAVGLVYTLARRITGSVAIAAVCAVGFMVSFGVWHYSNDAAAVTLPLFAALVVLLLLFPVDPERSPRPLLVAVAATFAILVYQTLAVVVIAALVAFLMDSGRVMAALLRTSATFVVATAALTGVVYLAVAATPVKLLFLGVVVVALLPWLAALAVWRTLLGPAARTVAILVTWGVLFAGFAVYWVPGDVSFFSPALAPWWLLIALILASLTTQRHRLLSPRSLSPAPGWWRLPCMGTSSRYRRCAATMSPTTSPTPSVLAPNRAT